MRLPPLIGSNDLSYIPDLPIVSASIVANARIVDSAICIVSVEQSGKMSAAHRAEAGGGDEDMQFLQRIFHTAVKVATKSGADSRTETHGSLTLYWCTKVRQPRIDVTRVTDKGTVLVKYVPESVESVHLHSGVERDGPTAILTITESGTGTEVVVTHLPAAEQEPAGIPASSVVDRVVWMKMSRRMTMDFVRYWCDHASPPAPGAGEQAEGPVLVMHAKRGQWPIIWSPEDPAAKARRRAGGRDYDEGGDHGSEIPGGGSGHGRRSAGMPRGQGQAQGGAESSIGPRGGAGTPSALSGGSSAYRVGARPAAFASLGQGRAYGAESSGGYDRLSARQPEGGGRGWAATSASGRSATSRAYSYTEQPGGQMRGNSGPVGQVDTVRALDDMIQRQTQQLAQLQMQTQQLQHAGMPAGSPPHMQQRLSPAMGHPNASPQWMDATAPVTGMSGLAAGSAMPGGGIPIMVHPGMAFITPGGTAYTSTPGPMGMPMYPAYSQPGQGYPQPPYGPG